MSPNKNYLDHLRSKSDNTKNVLAAVFAILPAILIGYAQFYMNGKDTEKNLAATEDIVESTDVVPVSAIASMGKIFSEGKASIGEAFDQLEKVDKQILQKAPENKVEDKGTSATGTAGDIDTNPITKTIE